MLSNRVRQLGFGLFVTAMIATSSPALAQPGDYNVDGVVSHADYSILGDTIGSVIDLRADGNFDGIVDLMDFQLYTAFYGVANASSAGPLPLTIAAQQLPSGNLEWTFAFADVNGALAGHLNISSSETILSVSGGPGFLDDGSATLDTPGINSLNLVQQGISFTANQAFVALGSSLMPPQGLLNSNSTLEFVRLVTKNIAPHTITSTLTFAGEYGYGGADYTIGGATTFVPEPSIWLIACTAGCLIALRRGFSRRN